MQYKNKKNLYKILFITILLGFIILLVGCNWFALGLLNIFDPQAQIRVNYTEIDLTEGVITLEIYSINKVEFIGEGFSYDYYVATTKIPEFSKTVGATFYVAPSTSPGTPGPITTIDNLPLYFQEVQDYLTSNPLITEITCTINLIGTDGAGHNITKPVTFDLPVLQPGIDVTPPTAVISVSPSTATGAAPFTVVFDASGSVDEDSGIASYSWDFGDGTSATGVTPAAHTYTTAGIYIVKLTVTDYYGNAGVDTATITVGSGVASAITLQAAPTTVTDITGSSTITATVKDANGNPVADGTPVTFSTTFGTLFSSYETTLDGIVTTELTFSAGDSSSTVTATSGSVSATVPVTYSPASGVPSAITLQASPATLAAAASSTITATVTDFGGSPVPDGTAVTFSTTLGTLSSLSATTTSGIASTILTHTLAGLVNVTATSGSVSEAVVVTFQ